jgi:hypothetical protein
MSENRRRIFIKSSLFREMEQYPQADPNHFLAQNGSVPLYVMMHLARPAAELADPEPVAFESHEYPPQDIEELSTDEDGELIRHLESHPDLFRATPFEMDDGSDAVAFDFARPRLYAVHRVKDEADWRLVMQTYDPTWAAGPAIGGGRRFKIRRKK